MSQENYDAKLPVLEAMDPEMIKVPNIPVNVFLQEANDLEEWAKVDQVQLEAAGLDWTLVDDLPVRAGALRHSQSIWMRERYSQEEAQAEWETQSPAAYELKNDLEADFRFAFRKRPDLLNKVKAIEEGTGHPDMIQDLSDLAVLGRDNLDLLSGIGVDAEKLDQAEAMATDMSDLLARVNGDRAEGNSEKVLRDRAYTHLKAAVDEIRETGKYVMRKDPKRVSGYRSNYHAG